MLWRNADFSCHAARRGAPTTARGRVRCAVAISTLNLTLILTQTLTIMLKMIKSKIANESSLFALFSLWALRNAPLTPATFINKDYYGSKAVADLGGEDAPPHQPKHNVHMNNT